MEIRRLSLADDLERLTSLLRPEEWDADNAMEPMDIRALAAIAGNRDYLFLTAHEEQDGAIIGILLGTKLLKTDGSCWLYVDELDTHPRWRRRGVAKALMSEAFAHAGSWGASEVWLGADQSSVAANAFYRSCDPSSIDEVCGYTFELGDG